MKQFLAYSMGLITEPDKTKAIKGRVFGTANYIINQIGGKVEFHDTKVLNIARIRQIHQALVVDLPDRCPEDAIDSAWMIILNRSHKTEIFLGFIGDRDVAENGFVFFQFNAGHEYAASVINALSALFEEVKADESNQN